MLHRADLILGACFFVIASATVLAACGPLAGKADKPVDTEVVATEFEGDQPGGCSDAADNDRDGKFDCDDEDSKGAPDCAALGFDSRDNAHSIVFPAQRVMEGSHV